MGKLEYWEQEKHIRVKYMAVWGFLAVMGALCSLITPYWVILFLFALAPFLRHAALYFALRTAIKRKTK